jgi:hypothetical protein
MKTGQSVEDCPVARGEWALIPSSSPNRGYCERLGPGRGERPGRRALAFASSLPCPWTEARSSKIMDMKSDPFPSPCTCTRACESYTNTPEFPCKPLEFPARTWVLALRQEAFPTEYVVTWFSFASILTNNRFLDIRPLRKSIGYRRDPCSRAACHRLVRQKLYCY